MEKEKMDTTIVNEIQDWVKGQGLDIEILCDKSGSMKQEKRMAHALEFTKAAAHVGALVDEDGGVGLTFFSDYPADETYEDLKADQIDAKFNNLVPSGSTETLAFLKAEVNQHYERKATKPEQKTLIVLITDGEPVGGETERKEIKAYLSELQKKVDWTQKVPELKVLAYQVGTDSGAKAFLQDLDNDDAACGLIVESVFDGKDSRTIEMIFRDALREHMVKN